ncbi:MAG: DNA topoisomerase I [Thaumarchaeota archaeon]|nr:DNA topoisomerase I [Nitrososphaerota archaeon]MCY3975990.1 DNA topoisomerase I [Nitrososphaerota archaeon]
MKWKTLQHNGILFPPPYQSHGITIKINGIDFKPNLLQEEMIYHWCKKKNTKYVNDKTFQQNFLKDFKKTLHVKSKNIKYSDIDFTYANKLIDKEKAVKELMNKDIKKLLTSYRKKIRDEMKEKYGKAVIDGEKVDIANYIAEPSGIFIGRGEHPLRGRWKYKITPHCVTLNLGREATVPIGKWKKIIHDKKSMWIACWEDMLTQKRKYVWLADTSQIKQKRDQAKYDKAIKLSKKINQIKKIIGIDMNDDNKTKKKIATVCYLIYRAAMRVGDEKDVDEVDTVGATTLRTEHTKLKNKKIKFDFLGKDSVRWQKDILINNKDDELFYDNLKELIENKKSEEEIFHGITSRHVNAYYSSIIHGLTAKVFRTYLATNVVRNNLQTKNMKSKPLHIKLYHAKLANLEAAKMCNHKKTISKTFQQSIQKKRDMLKKINAIKTKTKKQSDKLKIRKEKAVLAMKLLTKTKDYNLGTSLRNYIDPRVYKTWADEVEVEWEKLYSTSLQKKFLWIKNTK